MIRVGVKQAVVMPLLKDQNELETESGKPEVQYGAPVILPRLQKVELTPRMQSVDVDADDWTDTLDLCSGYDGTVTRDSFTPDDLALLLREKKIDDINVSTYHDEPGEFAFAFKAQLAGIKSNNPDKPMYSYVMVLKTKFSQGSYSAESKGNNKLTPQPDALSFKSSNRNADGAWRFHAYSDDPDFGKKFFTQETAQKLAGVAVQTFGNPAEVVFADVQPETGEAGKVYIVSDVAYYWNGSAFVESGRKATE